MKLTALVLMLALSMSCLTIPISNKPEEASKPPSKSPSFAVALTTPKGVPYCSASIVNIKERYALTADHCMDVPGVPLINGEPVTEVAHDPDNDMAIVYSAGINGDEIQVDWEDVNYTDLKAYGFPGEFPVVVEIDLKSYWPIAQFLNLPGYWMLAQPDVLPGMSGGPIVNEEGKLVAVCQMASPEAKGSLSRPIFVVKESLGKYFHQEEK